MIPIIIALLAIIGIGVWRIHRRHHMHHLVDERVDHFSLLCEKMMSVQQSMRRVDDHLVGLDDWGRRAFLSRLNEWLWHQFRYATYLELGSPAARYTYIVLHPRTEATRRPLAS